MKEEYFGKDATEADSPASLLEEKDFALPPSVPRELIRDAEELTLLFDGPDVDVSGLLAGTECAGGCRFGTFSHRARPTPPAGFKAHPAIAVLERTQKRLR